MGVDVAGALAAEQAFWTEARATVVAAIIAAVAAIVGTIVTAVNGARSRKQVKELEGSADARYREYTSREQWWTRFSWALEKAASPDENDAKLGLAVIYAMLDAPWVTTEDNEMALTITDMIEPPAEDGDGDV
ncbi:hypothetical protein PU560_17100 [Georgenia sp. 10Sc9-8]|uniref:Uncharacterized protein n=1 Tax=Georgenia halotolerans TaxID=3028317 RepID=A0ABT5U1V9_9MICO|nr:hypothetical protein [Georgenia halotolerans]